MKKKISIYLTIYLSVQWVFWECIHTTDFLIIVISFRQFSLNVNTLCTWAIGSSNRCKPSWTTGPFGKAKYVCVPTCAMSCCSKVGVERQNQQSLFWPSWLAVFDPAFEDRLWCWPSPISRNQKTKTIKNIYIYIYIYVCVYVCIYNKKYGRKKRRKEEMTFMMDKRITSSSSSISRRSWPFRFPLLISLNAGRTPLVQLF